MRYKNGHGTPKEPTGVKICVFNKFVPNLIVEKQFFPHLFELFFEKNRFSLIFCPYATLRFVESVFEGIY